MLSAEGQVPMTRNALDRRLPVVVILVSVTALIPFAAGPANAAGRLCGPPADTVPPQVTDVSLSPASVDVTDGPASVTVTVDATDTAADGSGSGIKRLQVSARGPHGFASTRLSIVSGTPDDGEWRGTLTIPQTARTGTWSIDEIDARDAARNDQYYSHYGQAVRSPTDLALQSGWQLSFAETNSSQSPPVVKPGKLTSFGFTPHSVDTTHHAKKVRVSASFSNPQPAAVNASFFGTARRGPRAFHHVSLKPTSHGKWSGRLTIHRWAGRVAAQAHLTAEYSSGVKPRFRNLNASDLAARHYPSALKITSGTDSTKPVLKDLSLSPASVNTTSGPRVVTMTVVASDADSGVSHVDAYLLHRGGRGDFAQVHLAQHGNTWMGQATIRECVTGGTWRINLNLQDRAGNFASYRTKSLQAAGLTSQLTVTSTRGDIESPSVSNSTASALDHAITLDFSEGVKNVTDSTLTVYPLQPASSRYTDPLPVSSITCSDGTSVIDCSGDDGLVTSAILQVAQVEGGQKYEVWANLDSETSQLTDAAGNPLGWSYAAAEVTGS
jgi:hypothetical protein